MARWYVDSPGKLGRWWYVKNEETRDTEASTHSYELARKIANLQEVTSTLEEIALRIEEDPDYYEYISPLVNKALELLK